MFNNYNEKFLKDWMYLSKEEIEAKRLIDLSIPGTKNSNIYNEKKIKKELKKDLSLTPQLEMGIRLFDLHFELNKEKTVIIDKKNSEKQENYFLSNFGRISVFLLEHPNEFIIVRMSSKSLISRKLKILFILQLNNYLKDYLIKKEDFEEWFDLEKVTMKDIWQRKRRILIISDYFLEFTNIQNYGVFRENKLFFKYYHDFNFPDMIFENDNNFEKMKIINDFIENKKKIEFYKNYNIEIHNKLNFILNKPKIHYFMNKKITEKEIIYFLIQNKEKNFNFFTFKKKKLTNNILLALISLNYDKKIKILNSWISDIEINKEINFYKYNQSCIFLGNLNILKNKKDKKLIILYEYENIKYFFISRNFFENVFIFNNPIIKKKYLLIKGFGILINKKYYFEKIFYEKKNLEGFLEKSNLKSFSKGFYCYENIINYL